MNQLQKNKQTQQRLRNTLCNLLQNQILENIPNKDFIDIETQSLILEDLDLMDLYTEESKIKHYQFKNNKLDLLNSKPIGEVEIYYNFKSAQVKINLYDNLVKPIKFSIPYSLLQND